MTTDGLQLFPDPMRPGTYALITVAFGVRRRPVPDKPHLIWMQGRWNVYLPREQMLKYFGATVNWRATI